jgi:hypothetical protein
MLIAVAASLIACGNPYGSRADGADGDGGAQLNSAPMGRTEGAFCSTLPKQPSLCEDFEGPNAQGATHQSAGAIASFVTTEDRGRSIRFEAPPSSSDIAAGYIQLASMRGATNRFAVSFDFNPSMEAPKTGALVIARAWLSETHHVTLLLANHADGPSVFEGEASGDDPSLWKTWAMERLPTPEEWTRYEIDMNIAARTVTVRANEALIATFPMAGNTFGKYSFQAGVQASTDVPYSARYDNIVIEIE